MEIKHFIPRDEGTGAVTKRVMAAGIEFCSLPYQPYYARLEKKSALVDSILVKGKPTETGGFEVDRKWFASVSDCKDDGSSIVINHKRFDNENDAFFWAAEKIKEGQVQ
jgi:hypothetical protein